MNAGAPITVFEVIDRRRLPAVQPHARPTCWCWRSGSAAGSTRPTWSTAPVATAITSISMDHMEFLGDTLAKIAFEKAGHHQARRALRHRRAGARRAGRHRRGGRGGGRAAAGARPGLEHRAARTAACATRCRAARWTCRRPALPGPHQADNAGIAIAALRAWGPPWLTRGRDRARASPRADLAGPAATPARPLGAPRCRRAGSCGWTAATMPGPGWPWPRTCAAGAIGRCTSSSA